jgi:hypothetical protein
MEETKPKALKVGFSGRATGMGAVTQVTLYSLKQRKPLEPAFQESSRTGNHWTDYYWLFPAKYLVAVRDISNTGKHNCRCEIMLVKPSTIPPTAYSNPAKHANDGEYAVVERVPCPKWVKPPCECLVIPQPQE